MKFFVVFSAIVACAVARPGFLHASPLIASGYVAAPYVHAVAPVEISSQYHAQDTLGQYTYGYSEGLSAKSESRSIDGVTHGGYSYVDANGVVQNVQYTADSVNGFRVAATNLPVAPKAEEKEAPKQVEDTPEVAQAKTEHFAAIEEAKVRNAAASSDDSESESVEVNAVGPAAVAYAPHAVYNYASPLAYHSYAYGVPAAYTTYAAHHYAPAVHAYSYSPYVHTHTPVVYAKHHVDVDTDVAKATAEHAQAHIETKARLAAAGVEV